MNFWCFFSCFCCWITELCDLVVWEKRTHAQMKRRKGERARETEIGRASGRKVKIMVKTHMNMGLKMFCEDLVRLHLFIIPLCCWTICCLFATVVSINKPVYDIILRFFPFSLFQSIHKFYHWNIRRLHSASIWSSEWEWRREREETQKWEENSTILKFSFCHSFCSAVVSPMPFTHSISKIAKYNNK